VLHGLPEHDTVIEENGHIDRGAVVHCCTIRRNALVGVSAVIMDNALVGEAAIVAACAFVNAGLEIHAAQDATAGAVRADRADSPGARAIETMRIMSSLPV